VHAAASWRPVGTVLLQNGSITQEQLDAALAEQAGSGRKLGEILTSSGAVTWLALAQAIAEQATDLVPAAASEPPPRAPAEPVAEVARAHADPSSAEERLLTVEAMLKDRQRAFLELVSVTETLRSTVARLQDELNSRNRELAQLRAEASLR
jgi:predicted component of type VI protein secretion system